MFKIFKYEKDLITAISQKVDGSMRFSQNRAKNKTILKNRERFLKKLNIHPSMIVSGGLSQDNRIKVVEKGDRGKIIKNTDGLLTKEKVLFLAITVADCLPIFIYDKREELVGILHAGWRGLSKNIASLAIKKMRKAFGSKPENILAGIGPGICLKHYSIGGKVIQHFQSFLEGLIFEKGKCFLDLKKIAKLQLLKEGLRFKNIEITPGCTFCQKDKYFSFRRDKPKEIEAMMAVIGIRLT